MPDSDSTPSERKIAALLLIAVVAGAIGLYSYGQEHPDTISSFNSIFKSISFPTGFSAFSAGRQQTVSIDSELTFETTPATEIKLQNPAEEFSVSFNNPNNTLTIDGTSWQYSSETKAIFENYTGSVILSQPLSLSGSAKGLSVNSAIIPESGKGISVSSPSLASDFAILKGLEGVDLQLKNVSGTINAKDDKNSAVYTISNMALSISSFKGDIEYYGKKIVLKGSGKIDTELLGVKKD
ncbi:Uncharacterised protein [uncultured archaeon]|nr:Uncharacterised protein [uncultured archaeon]